MEVDSLDLFQNRTLKIHDLKHFFATDPKRVNTYSHQRVTRNNSSTYRSCLTTCTLLIIMAIFKPEACIKPGIVLSGLVK